MQSSRALAGGEESGESGALGIAVHPDSTHDVVGGRANLHWRCGDVDIGELLELVVHARKLFNDVLPRVGDSLPDPGDVEEDTTVWAPPPFAHFAQDAAGDVVAGQQLGGPPGALVALGIAPPLLLAVCCLAAIILGDIVEHE